MSRTSKPVKRTDKVVLIIKSPDDRAVDEAVAAASKILTTHGTEHTISVEPIQYDYYHVRHITLNEALTSKIQTAFSKTNWSDLVEISVKENFVK
jgi:hypothetical protein